MGETNKKRPYCKPWNAGLESETPAVCRRLGRLFDALDTEINTNIADGQIVEDVRQCRSELQKQLLAEGWSMSYLDGNKMRVRPPGHKKPYGAEAIQTQPTEVQPYTPPDRDGQGAGKKPERKASEQPEHEAKAPNVSESEKATNTYTVYAWCVRPFRAYAEVEAETPEEAIVTARGLHDELLDTAEACSHKDYPWDEFAAENEQGEELLRVLDHEAQSETTGATPETVSGRSLSSTNTEREGESMSEQQAKQTQSTEQQESGKQQPLHKETHGAVQVTVWDNGPDREPSVSFGRPYRGPQGYRVAHSYRAKHLSDLMKATAAAALVLGRELERRPQTSAKGKAEQVCSIDSGRFTSVLGARWNATAEAYTYGAKILCDGKQVFGPMLNHELAGLQRIAKEEGLPWLATAVEKRRLPEPTEKDLQHFEKTLRASQALIERFIERGHKEVLKDTKLAEELGLEVSGSVEPGQKEQVLTVERER